MGSFLRILMGLAAVAPELKDTFKRVKKIVKPKKNVPTRPTLGE